MAFSNKRHSELQQILDGSGLSVDEFLRDVWGRRSLFIKGSSKKNKLEDIYSLEKWRAHLAENADSFTLTSQDPQGQEQDVLAQQAEALLADGHTICGKVTSEVSAFLQAWSAQVGGIGAPSASIYESSHGGGFVTHWDRFHVVILQLAGSKVWSYGLSPEVRAPRDNFAVGQGCVYIDDDGRQIEGPDITTLITTRLDPGDCLYLPPGTWHRGIACGHSVALSLSPGQDSVASMLSRVVERCLVQHSPSYRMGFPGSPIDRDGGIPANISSLLVKSLADLKHAVEALTLADLDREWTSQTERGIAQLDVERPSLRKTTTTMLTPTTRLARVRSRPIRYVRAPKRFAAAGAGGNDEKQKQQMLMVYCGDLELALPTFAEPLLRGLNEHRTFIASEALDWDKENTWESVRAFLETLIRLGLLRATGSSSDRESVGAGSSHLQP